MNRWRKIKLDKIKRQQRRILGQLLAKAGAT